MTADTQPVIPPETKSRQARGLKGACRRYHGPDCNCWKDKANDL